MEIWTIGIFILAGLLSGFLAGVFGIGGGVVLVPIFWFIFPKIGIPQEEVVKLSVGTSLSIITVTTLLTSGTHLLKGKLKIEEVGKLILSAAFGVAVGIYLSQNLPSYALKKLFAVMLIVTAVKQLSGKHSKPKNSPLNEQLLIPATVFLSALLSSLLGIGGGVVVNSILFSLTAKDTTKVVAIASTVSFINALLGTIGYFFTPPNCKVHLQVGYIYIPALIFVSLGALLGSKLGLKLLYKIEGQKLKKWFSLLLLAVAAKILL